MAGRSDRGEPRYGPVPRSAVDRGLDIVTSVKDTAAEVIRTRRDPAHIAERRRAAAKRRLMIWSIAGLVLLGVGATGIAEAIGGEGTAASIGAMVLVVGLFVYCVIGSVSAARDLKARGRVVRQLPPPQPARRPVGGAARPLISQLDGYSDALRASVGMVGIATGTSADDAVLALRDETLAAADAAEVRIRSRAVEFTALQRAAGTGLDAGIEAARDRLEREISAGVAEYGRLVAAASEAAVASAQLVLTTAPSGVAEMTERLAALSAGMRELTSQRDTRTGS